LRESTSYNGFPVRVDIFSVVSDGMRTWRWWTVLLPGLLTLGLVFVLKYGKDGGLGVEVVVDSVRDTDTFAVRRQRLEVRGRYS
jgi:hypothetical protein